MFQGLQQFMRAAVLIQNYSRLQNLENIKKHCIEI